MDDKDLAPDLEQALNRASDAELYELARRLAKNARFRKVLARKLSDHLTTR
ncbi:hypothetical protein GGP53_003160 [Salinibacter ruber]|nr:hypothetical protein [Salinibacter ruber]MCS4146188.1 hypothetical protein [Salinibacter ruber]